MNETLRQFAPLSGDTLEVSWEWIFSDSIITNFLLILTVK